MCTRSDRTIRSSELRRLGESEGGRKVGGAGRGGRIDAAGLMGLPPRQSVIRRGFVRFAVPLFVSAFRSIRHLFGADLPLVFGVDIFLEEV